MDRYPSYGDFWVWLILDWLCEIDFMGIVYGCLICGKYVEICFDILDCLGDPMLSVGVELIWNDCNGLDLMFGDDY